MRPCLDEAALVTRPCVVPYGTPAKVSVLDVIGSQCDRTARQQTTCTGLRRATATKGGLEASRCVVSVCTLIPRHDMHCEHAADSTDD